MNDPRVRRMFEPRSVAVIGASRDARNLGRQVLENIRAAGYTGALYAVNPHTPALGDITSYPTIAAVPAPVDLAIVAVPAPAVLGVVAQCADAGIESLVIISAGFRETGDEGAAREAQLQEMLRARGIRAMGPNCMGVLSTDPRVRLNATFARDMPDAGPVAFVSQSGALGIALLALARSLGVGIRYFASLGNKTDLSTNDLLEAWENDESVRVILLYLENFGNPRNFLRLARRISPRKPIIAVKSGRTSEGAAAARTHTGALAELDRAAQALFEQGGVVRARSVEELFDLGRAFADAPLPPGDRIAIVTNSGGPGILATDALRDLGLPLAVLSPETVAALKLHLPSEVEPRNPMDMIAGVRPADYDAAMRAILADPNVDALLAIYTPPLPDDEPQVIDSIIRNAGQAKPVLACVMARETGSVAFQRLNAAHVPAYAFPESAARAMSALVEHARWRRRPQPEPELPRGPRPERAHARIAQAMAVGAEWLDADEALALLEDRGIAVVPTARAATPEEAAAVAPKLGARVAMKAIGPTLVHKSDAGAIALQIDSTHEALSAARGVVGRAREHGHEPTGILVQAMASPGIEMIVGMEADPKFGPMMIVGLGGIYSEILRDTSLRLAPLTRLDAEEMLQRLHARAMLEGARGHDPADRSAIVDALLKLSALAMDEPAIRGIEANPLIVGARGAVVVDARVLLWPGGVAPRAAGVLSER